MYRNYKNIRVIAVNSENKTINNLYLDLSGQRHYLTALRMSAPLYGMLRKGIRMEDLTRWNGHSHVPKCPARYMRRLHPHIRSISSAVIPNSEAASVLS